MLIERRGSKWNCFGGSHWFLPRTLQVLVTPLCTTLMAHCGMSADCRSNGWKHKWLYVETMGARVLASTIWYGSNCWYGSNISNWYGSNCLLIHYSGKNIFRDMNGIFCTVRRVGKCYNNEQFDDFTVFINTWVLRNRSGCGCCSSCVRNKHCYTYRCELPSVLMIMNKALIICFSLQLLLKVSWPGNLTLARSCRAVLYMHAQVRVKWNIVSVCVGGQQWVGSGCSGTAFREPV